ncbi:hypothetical protein HOG98_03355 [bacterium]|jgi:hypothetical protein|nr:hypothetical protein [bacterium]
MVHTTYKHKVISLVKIQSFIEKQDEEMTAESKAKRECIDWLKSEGFEYETPVFQAKYIKGSFESGFDFITKNKGVIPLNLSVPLKTSDKDGKTHTILRSFNLKFPFEFPSMESVSEKFSPERLKSENEWFEEMFNYGKIRADIIKSLEESILAKVTVEEKLEFALKSSMQQLTISSDLFDSLDDEERAPSPLDSELKEFEASIDERKKKVKQFLHTIDKLILNQQRNMPLLLTSLTFNSVSSPDYVECSRVQNSILFDSDSLFENIDFPFLEDMSLTRTVLDRFRGGLGKHKPEREIRVLNDAFSGKGYEFARIGAEGVLRSIIDLMKKVREVDLRCKSTPGYVEMEDPILRSFDDYFDGQYNEMHGEKQTTARDDSALTKTWELGDFGANELTANKWKKFANRSLKSLKSLLSMDGSAYSATSDLNDSDSSLSMGNVDLSISRSGAALGRLLSESDLTDFKQVVDISDSSGALVEKPRTVRRHSKNETGPHEIEVEKIRKRKRDRARGVGCVYEMALVANGIKLTYNGVELPSLLDENIDFGKLPKALGVYFAILKVFFKTLGLVNDLISSSREDEEEDNKALSNEVLSTNKILSKIEGIKKNISDLECYFEGKKDKPRQLKPSSKDTKGTIPDVKDIGLKKLIGKFKELYTEKIESSSMKNYDKSISNSVEYFDNPDLNEETNAVLRDFVVGEANISDAEATFKKEYAEFNKAIKVLIEWMSGYTVSEIIILNGRNAQLVSVDNFEEIAGESADRVLGEFVADEVTGILNGLEGEGFLGNTDPSNIQLDLNSDKE